MTRLHASVLGPSAQFPWKTLLLGAGAALAPARSGPAQCTELTYPLGPGLTAPFGDNGSVDVAIEFGGSLYVGGEFEEAGGLPAMHVARWDGAQWHALGEGISGSSNGVFALAVWDDGSGPALYAGGRFGLAGGLSASNVARWDGSSWEALTGPSGQGASGPVYALAVHDDGTGSALYVGGTFPSAGGFPASNVARWDGTQWSALASGTDARVDDLLSFDFGNGPELVAAGQFGSASGVPGTQLVARWNGSSWGALGSGLTPTFSHARALESFDSGVGPELYVGGAFEEPVSGDSFRMVRWNGAAFDFLGEGGVVHDLQAWSRPSGLELVLCGPIGPDQLATWNGAAFSAIPTGINPNKTIDSLSVFDEGSGPMLFAGGTFLELSAGAGILEMNAIGRWDGAEWSPLGTQAQNLNGSVQDLQLFDDGLGGGPAIYVGGAFTHAGALQVNRVARWSGSSWSPLGLGTNGEVTELAVHDDGNGPALHAAGYFDSAGGIPTSTTAKWDGLQWSALGAGPGGFVESMASFDDGSGPALYAGGDALAVKRWDGNAWSPVGANAPTAWSMAVHDDGTGAALYVGHGGSLLNSSGDVWKWDGAAWTSIGPTNSRVRSLHSFDDGSGQALYAGGSFTTIGGVAAEWLARWNGTAWSAMPGHPFDARVRSMATYDDGAGVRLAAGGGDPGTVALWDGTSWESLSVLFVKSAFHDKPGALEAWDHQLFAGKAVGKGIAIWGPSCICPPVAYCTAGTSTNGCTALISASGMASASGVTGFDVHVQGVEGEKAGLLYFGTSGAKATPWGAGTSWQCVKGPTLRLPMQDSGGTAGLCDGAFQLDFNAWMAANPAKAPEAGATVWMQAYYRDPPAPKSTQFSDALEFSTCP